MSMPSRNSFRLKSVGEVIPLLPALVFRECLYESIKPVPHGRTFKSGIWAFQNFVNSNHFSQYRRTYGESQGYKRPSPCKSGSESDPRGRWGNVISRNNL